MPEKTGDQFIKMAHPCPKCQATLEREVKTSRVICLGCKATWPCLRDALIEIAASKKTAPADRVRDGLHKAKIAVRASRNVAHRARTLGVLFGNIAGAISELRKEGSDKQEIIAQVGAELENVVDEAELAVENITEAFGGQLNPDVPVKLEPEPEPEPKPESEEEND